MQAASTSHNLIRHEVRCDFKSPRHSSLSSFVNSRGFSCVWFQSHENKARLQHRRSAWCGEWEGHRPRGSPRPGAGRLASDSLPRDPWPPAWPGAAFPWLPLQPSLGFPLPCAASHCPTKARACPSPRMSRGGLRTALLAHRPLSSPLPGSPGLPPPKIPSPPYLGIVGATQLSHSLSKSPAPLGGRACLILAFLVGA